MNEVKVSHQAPAFKKKAIVDGRVKEITLSAYTSAKHWLVLIFYPAAFSFVCPTEIKAFSSRLEEFLYSRSCAVAFVSTDSEHCLRAWNNMSDMEGGLGGIHVPLISDSNHSLCRDYGVLIEETGMAERALFIIDPTGVVRGVTINDANIGRSVDETLRVIDALAFKDEFGEGCPVDWKKGDKGIDVGTRHNSEAPFEVRPKSWTDWAKNARPMLGRAFSGASQRSLASIAPADRTVPTLATINSAVTIENGAQSPETPRSRAISIANTPMSQATRPGPIRYNSQSSLLSPLSHSTPTLMEQKMEAPDGAPAVGESAGCDGESAPEQWRWHC